MEEQKKQELGNRSLTSEFVPYELALKLKELGFDESCFGRWWFRADMHRVNEEKLEIIKSYYFELPEYYILAPTFSQCFRWFDYSTEWSGFIVPSKEEGCFEWWIQNYEDPQLSIESEDWYREREEAELACLEKLIEIVESKSE